MGTCSVLAADMTEPSPARFPCGAQSCSAHPASLGDRGLYPPRGVEVKLQHPPLGSRPAEVGPHSLTRPRFSLWLSSSGMGRYTARATQLAKMVSRMMVSKGLQRSQGVRRGTCGWSRECTGGLCGHRGPATGPHRTSAPGGGAGGDPPPSGG